MRVLVTGDTGFVGRYVCKRLIQEGDEVHGISRAAFDTVPWPHSPINVTNEQHVPYIKKLIKEFVPDAVLHLAGNPHVKDSSNEALITNVIGTHNLVSAVQECHMYRIPFILASSGVVYGGKTYIDIPANSNYSLGKSLCEQILIKSRLENYYFLRMFAQVGPFPTHGLLGAIFQKLKKNREEIDLIGPYPGSIKPYTHIQETFATVFQLIQARQRRQDTIQNVCASTNVSVADVVDIVQQELGFTFNVTWNGEDWAGDDKRVEPVECRRPMKTSEEYIRYAVSEIKRQDDFIDWC